MPDTLAPPQTMTFRHEGETVEEFTASDRFKPFLVHCFAEGIKLAVARDQERLKIEAP